MCSIYSALSYVGIGAVFGGIVSTMFIDRNLLRMIKEGRECYQRATDKLIKSGEEIEKATKIYEEAARIWDLISKHEAKKSVGLEDDYKRTN